MSTAVNNWYRNKRLSGLWRFAISISILNVLGYTVLGFEQAWAHPVVALAAAYGMELGIEAMRAWSEGRRPRFLGTPRVFAEFLLSAHITAMAVSMLLYANQRFWVIAFAAAVSIGSKELFQLQIPVPGRAMQAAPRRHFLNPSNFGITVTLLLFPWVGIAPPYQFTETLRGPLDILFPLLIVCIGSFLNTRFTERIPLILAWVLGFFGQAVIRGVWEGTPIVPALLPATGFAFILFTFYMVTDPGTTPSGRRGQIVFGASVAAVYGLLVAAHVVFGLFFALTIVTLSRGVLIYWNAAQIPAAGPARAPVGELALVSNG